MVNLLTIVVTILFCCVQNVCLQAAGYSVPIPTITAFKPKGIRVSIPDVQGLELFGFHGNVNSQISGTGAKESGQISRDCLKATSGLWTIEDRDIQLEVGDSIYYWISIQYNRLGYRKENQHFRVETLTPLGDIILQGGNSTSQNCDATSTTVNGKTKCRGEIIFSEDFSASTVDKSKWTVSNRICNEPDFEFVTYKSTNQKIENGILKIKPTVLTDDDYIRTGILDLGASCTSQLGSKDCVKSGSGYTILPPITSAQLTTQNKFSFQYGKIEIRAKFPEGDWLFPELYLMPKDSEYGRDYGSGKIQIGFARGNRALQTERGENIDSKVLSAGFVLANNGPLRKYGIRSKSSDAAAWCNDFHLYSLIWKPDGITVAVDNEDYGTVHYPENGLSTIANQNNNFNLGMKWNTREAPFDKEFYLAIGLGVGGLTDDFPDKSYGTYAKPWTNTNPKYLLSFYQNKHQWHPTWKEEESSLQIDYVKVYAL